MPKATPWREVRGRRNFGPEAEDRIAKRVEEMEADMIAHGLAELRQQREVTQAQLATLLGIDPTSLSRREHSTDPRLSTVRNQVEALGGRLQIVARFDDERIAIDL